jgi:hypothetical protein
MAISRARIQCVKLISSPGPIFEPVLPAEAIQSPDQLAGQILKQRAAWAADSPLELFEEMRFGPSSVHRPDNECLTIDSIRMRADRSRSVKGNLAQPLAEVERLLQCSAGKPVQP